MAKKRTSKKTSSPPRKLAEPAAMLVAAEKAPSVFNIAAYFRAIYVMRQKGYSWRQLESWVHEFGVEISAVHLRRLYVQENARLTEMSAEGLAAQGCPEDN